VAQRGYHLAPFQKRKLYCKLKKEDMDLPIFELSDLVKATNNFSSVNKIGEGGFGPVYKVIQTHSMKIVTYSTKFNYLNYVFRVHS
jgi:serine/threonine protein kinase